MRLRRTDSWGCLIVLSAVLMLAGVLRGLRGVAHAPSPVAEPVLGPSPCDASLRTRVWYPSRLEVVRPCITVEGTVRAKDDSDDGDLLLEVEVDGPYLKQYSREGDGQIPLLNEANRRQLNSRLLVELVCRRPTRKVSAAQACDGYSPSGAEPGLGDYIRVLGPHVLDTSHGWMEIHPAEVLVLRTSPRH